MPAASRRFRRAAVCPSAGQGQAGRKALKDIKTMKDDAAAVEKQGEEIKAKYTQIFKV
jgi:hypothetical protein